MSRRNILLVEDDIELAELVVRMLQPQSIDVVAVTTLAHARQQLKSLNHEVLVLDIMLPDGSGLDLCREIKASMPSLPVLILSARGDTIDRVLGLEIGADDYLTKPFDAAELTARIRALLRRSLLDKASLATRKSFGQMQIDLLGRSARLHEQELHLSTTEYKVLIALSEQPGIPLSRERLSHMVQPGAYMPSDRSVDVQVARLRKKLREADPDFEWIQTVRSEGYVFVQPPQR
jgi:DNA-binding response OmpR family regulator